MRYIILCTNSSYTPYYFYYFYFLYRTRRWPRSSRSRWGGGCRRAISHDNKASLEQVSFLSLSLSLCSHFHIYPDVIYYNTLLLLIIILIFNYIRDRSGAVMMTSVDIVVSRRVGDTVSTTNRKAIWRKKINYNNYYFAFSYYNI